MEYFWILMEMLTTRFKEGGGVGSPVRWGSLNYRLTSLRIAAGARMPLGRKGIPGAGGLDPPPRPPLTRHPHPQKPLDPLPSEGRRTLERGPAEADGGSAWGPLRFPLGGDDSQPVDFPRSWI